MLHIYVFIYLNFYCYFNLYSLFYIKYPGYLASRDTVQMQYTRIGLYSAYVMFP